MLKIEYLKFQISSSTSTPTSQAFFKTPLRLHDHFILTSTPPPLKLPQIPLLFSKIKAYFAYRWSGITLSYLFWGSDFK